MKKYIFLCLLLVLCACKNKVQNEVEEIVREWSGKEILFPDNLVFTIQGKDTVDFPISTEKYKILTYVDSTNCIGCKLQLDNWKKLMKETDSIVPNKVQFLYFYSPKNKQNIIGNFKSAGFTHPVCIDEKKALDALNKFPRYENFQTFLLNRDNKVLVVGNPIHNPYIQELYIKTIKGETTEPISEKSPALTEAEVETHRLSLGDFSWKQPQTATFKLTNKGNHPLVIQGITTSCGCISIKHTKAPIKPQKTALIEITYKADHPEHFDKTLTVYCNTPASPIVFRVSGNAI